MKTTTHWKPTGNTRHSAHSFQKIFISAKKKSTRENCKLSPFSIASKRGACYWHFELTSDNLWCRSIGGVCQLLQRSELEPSPSNKLGVMLCKWVMYKPAHQCRYQSNIHSFIIKFSSLCPLYRPIIVPIMIRYTDLFELDYNYLRCWKNEGCGRK